MMSSKCNYLSRSWREKNKLAESRESLRNELEHAVLLKGDLELL
jgi:hypothetical protein